MIYFVESFNATVNFELKIDITDMFLLKNQYFCLTKSVPDDEHTT